MQRIQGQNKDAEKSFIESARLDPNFAVPLVLAAELETTSGDSESALAHSERAIQINPAAFPEAYASNAVANAALQKPDVAEANARKGLAIDTAHQFPELEYALGMTLYSKDEKQEARKQFESYLRHSPDGPNALTARKVITELTQGLTSVVVQADKNSVPPPSESIAISHPSGVPLSGDAPPPSLLQVANAELLKKAPSETCLESVSRNQVDERGKIRAGGLIRADIAVSDGHEIYGQADGKRFEDRHQWDVLGYGFSTIGLFNSMSRALIAGNRLEITPAGALDVGGEAVYRYDFHTVPGADDWAIQYGKESGHAGEQGWFLVDRKTLVLRTVYVRTANLPANLKFSRLSALIEYEVETMNGQLTLLPSAARVELIEHGGSKRVAQMSFDHCREFGAESTLLVDSASDGSKATERPRMPIDTQIVITLNDGFDPRKPDNSGAITGRVLKQVSWNGQVMIPEGASVEGHMRPRRDGRGVVIEVDRVQTRIGWAPFYAELTTLSVHGGALIDKNNDQAPALSGEVAAIDLLHVPGVASISFTNADATLPSGTQMVWKAEALSPKTDAVKTPEMTTQVGFR